MTSIAALDDDDELVIITPTRGVEIVDNTWDIIPADAKILLLRKKTRPSARFSYNLVMLYCGVALLLFERYGAWGLIVGSIALSLVMIMASAIGRNVTRSLHNSARSSRASSAGGRVTEMDADDSTTSS